jgi:hypothetical protein
MSTANWKSPSADKILGKPLPAKPRPAYVISFSKEITISLVSVDRESAGSCDNQSNQFPQCFPNITHVTLGKDCYEDFKISKEF